MEMLCLRIPNYPMDDGPTSTKYHDMSHVLYFNNSGLWPL